MRKARQEVMANRSDRDPPSLHDVQGRQARHGNEARIGSSHQGQRAQNPHKRPDTKLQPAFPSLLIDPCINGGVHTNVMICHEARHRSCSVSRPRRRETPLAKCHEMSCFVMFPMPLPTLRRPVFAYRASIALRSVPPPPGPFAARIARGRGRPLAPARFARLIAPARKAAAGRTSPVRSRRGFFRPQPPFCAEKEKAAPASRLSLHPS